MTPVRRRNFILGFLGLLGLFAGLLFLSLPAPGASAALAPDLSPAPGPGPAQPVRQVPLERPPPSRFDAGLRVLAAPEVPSGPVDKRQNPGPDAARQMEIIRYAFETLDEDVRSCLEQWEAVAPGQASEVMIAFEIDAAGLQRSWLEHEGEVPFGPRTCLANAVYGLDWSKIVDQPAKLTQRFELGRADAR